MTTLMAVWGAVAPHVAVANVVALGLILAAIATELAGLMRRARRTGTGPFDEVTRPRPGSAAAPRIVIRRGAEDLSALGTAWEALERAAGSSVFQTHAWLSAWWRGAAGARRCRLHLVLAWEGDELVGVLPLVTRWHRGLRVLEWMAKECSDYCDALLAPGRTDLLEPMWHAVHVEGGYDIAWLSHLRPGAAAARLECPDTRLARSKRRDVSAGMRLDAWPDAEALLRGLGKKGRNKLRRGQRILQEHGPVRLRLVGPEEVPAKIERLRQFKRAWLHRHGLRSTLFDDDGALLGALVDCLARKGVLRVFVLEAGERVTAVHLGFIEGETLCSYLAAFDGALDRASPGTILDIEVACWAIRQGLAELDFLCGGEEFKLRLADRSEDLVALVGARTPLGHVALACDARLRDTLSRLRRPRMDEAPVDQRASDPVPTASRSEA